MFNDWFIKRYYLLRHYLICFKIRIKRLTFKRLKNLWAVESAFLRRKTIVNAFPYEMIIEPTNICQLKCPLCFTGTGEAKRPKGFMQKSVFEEIIATLGPYAFHVFLHLWGESFLHREIISFIKAANKVNLSTSISSNFSFLLSEEQAAEIIKSGLDVLVIALDGTTAEAYSQYRVGGNYALVVSNLKLLVRKKRELRSRLPYIKWHYIVMSHNEHQIHEAQRMAKEIGVDALVFSNAFLRSEQQGAKQSQKWLPRNRNYHNKYLLSKPDYLSKGCWWLWRSVVINWDGGVSPCCTIADKNTDFGSFNKDFIRVWNNEHYQSARHLFFRQPARPAGMRTVCHGCKVANKIA